MSYCEYIWIYPDIVPVTGILWSSAGAQRPEIFLRQQLKVVSLLPAFLLEPLRECQTEISDNIETGKCMQIPSGRPSCKYILVI